MQEVLGQSEGVEQCLDLIYILENSLSALVGGWEWELGERC